MTATTKLTVGGPAARRELELDAEALAALPATAQVPDVGTLVSGREGAAVRLSALAVLADVEDDAKLVHVESADGGFTANVPLDQALAGGLVLYALDGDPLPAKYGGPFRLLFVDEEDCSVNVKFLASVDFAAEPGSHTARCADE